ncbi:3-keto-L-gulonate kinase [Yersinia pestis S3]|nr:3-keto-L-gulonate kinase [Yersinia pestis S3]
MSHYFLGIDLGGTVTKAGIYTADGSEIAVTEQALPVLSPQAGFCERDMEALWIATCQVIRQTLNKACALSEYHIAAENIGGISFSAHGKGLYLVDKQGLPVRNGIVSSDSRAQKLVNRWQQEGKDHAAYERSLQQLWPSHPAALLRWLKENEPENYQRSGYVLMVHDYIRYRLTGEFTIEETNISGSNLYNQYNGSFDPQLMAIFAIEEVMEKTAPIIGSADLAGHVSEDAANACGLKAGTPVFGGMFDVVGAALTSGLHDSRQLSAVAGTWSIATRIFEAITPSEYPYVWGKYCIPGTYFVHEGSPTSASNLAWFVKQFLPELPNSYQTLNQWAALGYEKSEDILFFPWLYGSNHSANLSGGLLGLSGITISKTLCTPFIREWFFHIFCIRTRFWRWMTPSTVSALPVARHIPLFGCRCSAMPVICHWKLSIFSNPAAGQRRCVRRWGATITTGLKRRSAPARPLSPACSPMLKNISDYGRVLTNSNRSLKRSAR